MTIFGMNEPATYITLIICAGIVLLAIWAGISKNKRIRNSMPNFVTIVGVLGTFIGIFIGLWDFDVSNIEGSIPTLLSGLKTAFLTSITGMTAALLLRFGNFITFKEETKNESELTPEFVVKKFNNIEKIIDDLSNLQKSNFNLFTEKIENILKAISGEGDTTITTQLQKLRLESNEKQQEILKEINNFKESVTEKADKSLKNQENLIQAFQDFADDVAKQNTSALIEALEQVMRDFNTKINEQFGDNFKQLNEAVGRILEWQKNYKEQLEQMSILFQKSVDNIEKVEEAITRIARESSSIVESSEQLKNVLEAFDNIKSDIEEELETFSSIAEKANEAIPEIYSHIENITEKIVNKFNETAETLDESQKSIKKSINLNIKAIEDQTNKLDDVITQSQTISERMMRAVGDNIEKIIQDSAEIMQNQVNNLDETLQEELNKALQSLGSQLASLSEKFVADYMPLTEKLRKVVEIAKRIEDSEELL